MDHTKWIFTLVFLGAILSGQCAEETQGKRSGKAFNVFQVISFPNGPCEGSGSRNGTCYTEQECEHKGGTNSGSCASGFGVCCTFTVNCGERTSENCTYFESSGVTAGSCQAEICPCNDNICQMRLDFDTFVITGPSTNTNTITLRRPNGGDVTAKATAATPNPISLSNFGQCLTDTFSVSNAEGANPPTICGTNSGEHMYVEAGSECCTKLSFALGGTGVGAPVASRQWNIKVTQYSCNSHNLAPQGCVQYFYGPQVDTVQSYNYNNGNGIHLASQDQQICVRRERNNCRICWTVVNNADFALSGMSAYAAFNGNQCCDYGAPSAQTKTKGFDCVQIPGALQDNSNPAPRNSHVCGNNSGLKGGSVCSTRSPFQLNFRSDLWETGPEAMNGAATANRGFQIVYIMDNNGCNSAEVMG